MRRADIAYSIDAVRLAHVRVQHFNAERSHASETPGLPLLKQAPHISVTQACNQFFHCTQ